MQAEVKNTLFEDGRHHNLHVQNLPTREDFLLITKLGRSFKKTTDEMRKFYS